MTNCQTDLANWTNQRDVKQMYNSYILNATKRAHAERSGMSERISTLVEKERDHLTRRLLQYQLY